MKESLLVRVLALGAGLLLAAGLAVAQEDDAAPPEGGAQNISSFHSREAAKLRERLLQRGRRIREHGGVYDVNMLPVVMLWDPEQAPEQRIAGVHLVVAGEPWNNPLVEKALESLPVVMRPEKRDFAAGRFRVSEGHWQLIARVRSPWNKDKACYVLTGLTPEAVWWDTDMLYELEEGEWLLRLGYQIAARGLPDGKMEYINFGQGWNKAEDAAPGEPLLTLYGPDAEMLREALPEWRAALRRLEGRLGLRPRDGMTVMLHATPETVHRLTRRWPHESVGEDILADPLSGTLHAVTRGKTPPQPWTAAELVLRQRWGEPADEDLGPVLALAASGVLEGRPLWRWGRRLEETDFPQGSMLEAVWMAARLDFAREANGPAFLEKLWRGGDWKQASEKVHRAAGMGKNSFGEAYLAWLDAHEAAEAAKAPAKKTAPCLEPVVHDAAFNEAVEALWSRTKPPEKIEPVLRAALEREPRDCEARRHLAELLFRAGRYAESSALLKDITNEP